VRDVDWEIASMKNTSVLGGRSIRQVQYSSSKSHPIVVRALEFGSFAKTPKAHEVKEQKKSKISPAVKNKNGFISFL
jgi:hypothetical protein